MPESNVSILSTIVYCFRLGVLRHQLKFRTRSFFATFSQPHGPPRVGRPGKMLQVSGSQTLREKVLMTTVSDAYPTENFKASFSSSPFLKQCSSVICFAISGKKGLTWMPWQLICMARHPQTSIKSLQDLCNRFREKLFQPSRRKLHHQLRQVRNLLKPEAEQLAKAKRKLEEAGIDLTPVKDKQQKSAPSSTAPALPTTFTKTPVEQILERELPNKLSSVPSSSSQDAVDKWLKKHQSQFRGKAAAFKKHVAEVCLIFKSSEAKRQDLADTAIKYGLQKSHASKMSFANLSKFIGACQFEAA